MNTYKERLGFAVQHFAVSHLLLLLLLLCTRLFELAGFGLTGLFPSHLMPIFENGFLNNTLFWAFLSLCTFPVYLLCYVIIGSSTRYFLLPVFVVYILVYVSVVQYFIITRSMLGAEFWTYSWSEIKEIIQASPSVSWLTFIPYGIVLGLLFWLYPKAQELILPKRQLVGVYISMLVGSVCYGLWNPSPQRFSSELEYVVSVNKLAFFVEQSCSLLNRNEQETIETAIQSPVEKSGNRMDGLSEEDQVLLDSLGVDTLDDEQLFNLANKLTRANNLNLSRLLAVYVLNTTPDYTDMRLLLGWTYGWQNNYKEAKSIFEECIRRDPENSQPWKELIALEIKYKKYTRALHRSNQAFELFQEDTFKLLQQKVISTLSEHKN